MSKIINLNYRGKEYTLEYTRRSVKQAEANGFEITNLANGYKPVTMISKLFHGAFLAHHRDVSDDLTDEIYGLLPDHTKLLERLIEMYNDAAKTLIDEPEKSEGNLAWGANW